MSCANLICVLNFQKQKDVRGGVFMGRKAHHPDRERAMFLKDRCCAWIVIQPVFQCTNGCAIRGRSASRTSAAA
ncbi:hypothetical protein AA0228_0400 [Gluconobacter frateurii NRIC 0228]|uniref:Transposase n=1 Tax=Gluconobacter frateurii NRIC 0228 TaxID=1307946 RepID=A0ABQ0Q885_9PROT|nr:hypothetical protein AA0228_0400 [Gluconobacter frateurii NRIC 0228]